jgi:hypothetical protein
MVSNGIWPVLSLDHIAISPCSKPASDKGRSMNQILRIDSFNSAEPKSDSVSSDALDQLFRDLLALTP